MKLNELKAILLNAASDTAKEKGKTTFIKGLVTNFKGKKLGNIYNIYAKVKDKENSKEFDAHFKLDLLEKRLVEMQCSCGHLVYGTDDGKNSMCSHLTATAYKFINLLIKAKKDTPNLELQEENKRREKLCTVKLQRKTDKGFEYYLGQKDLKSPRLTLQPNELREFLEGIVNKKIKFKYEYIEFIVPILHKNLPLTFNLKEDGDRIILTTHKVLPIPLNSKNDVYYFRNELYLPSKEQTEKYAPLYEKLKVKGQLVYRKDINTYNKLISLLSAIAENINIAESLKNYVSDSLIPEFYLYEEKGRVYCQIYLSYGGRKFNIIHDHFGKDTLLRDRKKEDLLLMKVEKYNFIKLKNRFMLTGGDEELFKIMSGRGNSIRSLGKVILGKGLKDRKIYTSDSIEVDLLEVNGEYNFSYNIGNLNREELKSAFEAYRAKEKFYKTRSNDFLDFEDEGIRNLFKTFDFLDIDYEVENGQVNLEKSKALFLYENLKGDFIKAPKGLIDIEKKLAAIATKSMPVPQNFNGNLREYQLTGFKWLRTLSELGFGGILADEMGLGKTVQIIAFLLSEENKKTLIICPTSLIYNWKEEIERFAPDLKVLVVHGADRSENLLSMDEYDVLLTTYGTLKLDIERYGDTVFDFCIIDEAQNIKNANAQSSKLIKEIKATIRFALTGTPIENNLTELWSIFDFVMPGYLYTREKFVQKFILKGEENLEGLKLLIKPFILRRTKSEVIEELPKKIEKKLPVAMTAAQKSVYSNYIKTVRAKVKNNSQGKIEIFSYLTKLRQICLDPSLILRDYSGGSGKLEIALELIIDHIAEGSKILLFSQFTSVLDKIGARLDREEIKYYHLDGKTKSKERMRMVKEFNENRDIKVFLISLKAGGTGLNLTSANLVIHFDPWWNPAVEDQATDRAHRIGQNHIVEVIKLVAKGTIEEKIIQLQEDKKELIGSILTGELQTSSNLSGLTKEELIQLFIRD